MNRLGGRGEERVSDLGHKTRAVLIDVGQEALASSAEPVPLTSCGRGNTYGAFCTKPRGHSGRHQF